MQETLGGLPHGIEQGEVSSHCSHSSSHKRFCVASKVYTLGMNATHCTILNKLSSVHTVHAVHI